MNSDVTNSIVILDKLGQIVFVNPAAISLLGGKSEEGLVGQSITFLMDRFRSLPTEMLVLDRNSTGLHSLLGKAFQLELWKSDDDIIPIELCVSETTLSGLEYCFVTIRDLTEEQEYRRQIRDTLYVDSLTGYPNREALLRFLSDILSGAAARSKRYLMLEIGIDQMRMLNTTYGTEAGNVLIQEAGARLNNVLAPFVFFGRGAGDRFQVIFSISPGETAEQLFANLSKRLAEAMSGPFEIATARVAVSLTAGGLELPFLAGTPSHAIGYADMALYEAKSSHRGYSYLLSADDVSRVHELSALVNKIRSALQKQQFFPVFQPKIDLETGQCIAAECLIRWRTETGEMIPPGLFIPIAESVDLIEGIGRFIFLESCAALQEWRADPVLRCVKLAVNLSPKQLERDNFIDFVRKTLESFDIPPSSLEFEITETTIANNPDVTFERVRELTDMGVSVSIDDFGTGQSSLGMLRDVGATRAKVDRTFLEGVPHDYRANQLLGNIINLMRDMNLPVTVEGIETREVADFVRTLRCSEGQGYFFSKPLEKGDFESFVRETSLNVKWPRQSSSTLVDAGHSQEG